MRRKSERTASKKGEKAKPSPEKVEKIKRTRTRRRKHSTSSENESAEESTPVQVKEIVDEVEKKPPQTPVKEDSPEEAHDQVWQVKAAEGSGDVGEIKKLKICLTRPPSTPERVDRSPRSKRKHSRATSSSDTPSVEGVEEKKRSRHRSKRSTRESKDESDKNHDSQEEQDVDPEVAHDKSDEVSQSTDTPVGSNTDETPMSTTNEEVKTAEQSTTNTSTISEDNSQESTSENTEKASDADTTVASPKDDIAETVEKVNSEDKTNDVKGDSESQVSILHRDSIEDKSEILELHPDESKCESSDAEIDKSQNDAKVDESLKEVCEAEVPEPKENAEVSKKKEDETHSVSEQIESHNNENTKSDETNVVESSGKPKRDLRNSSTDSNVIKEDTIEAPRKSIQRTDSTPSSTEETPSAPIVINRKRRWGTRQNKLTTQKSITISTDVLKEIIPDVKPTEFEEVIEDKKNKREVTEKVERPILPKIIIDNSENVELNNKHDDNQIVKPRESQMSFNRKISIVKESDSIIARPPSPPRHKQSSILFITNLVRPFTLPQLKNLLQRTGRIAEEGFWIDRIKSKCFVKYEEEEQAIETRHALHGVTWPVNNPKTLQVDFSNEEAFEKAKLNEESDNAQVSTMPGTVEDWLREQDIKRERGELEKPYERKASMREWDMGKNDKDKEKDKLRRPDERSLDKRRHRSIERSPEPARKFKKKEEEAPAKLLDDLFRKTKATPCIYWLPLSAETIAVKEEQRRQHMAEHERRLLELRRTHRRH